MAPENIPPGDLAECDREPIHIPGSIQPHGVLLAADPEELTVIQAASPADSILGCDVDGLLNRTVHEILRSQLDLSPLSTAAHSPEPVFLGSIAVPADRSRRADVTAHNCDGTLIFEIEPSASEPKCAAEMLTELRLSSASLESSSDQGLLQAASREVRRLTGFDRVMIYRFLDDGTGSVDAEDKIEGIASLLNHRYPASDIPKQARRLYLQNTIRAIPDAEYTPAPLTPHLNPRNQRPLDMSNCALRSVSPVHIQYLKNMGVQASMSISLVVEGALWGLISCHHGSPKMVCYEVREACKQVGQILGHQIKARAEAAQNRQGRRLSATREEFLNTLARGPLLERELLTDIDAVRNLVPAEGAAVVFGKQINMVGHTPAEGCIRELSEWLLRSQPPLVPYTTDSLSREYGAAQAYAAEASGLLATVVANQDPLVLLWFRPEQLETIKWAGNPHKPLKPGATPGSLTPRTSFEIWRETVHHRSQPWSLAEIDAARRLGRGILDLRQQRALKELNRQLQQALSDKEVLLVQKDLLMQEANHRVQNSLQLVNAMLQLEASQVVDPDMKAHFDEAVRRILAVSAVHKRLWRSDNITTVDFGKYLDELCDGLIETWGSSWQGHIRICANPVLIPTDQAVTMALIITELLTNAVKYAYKGNPGPIDIDVREEGARAVRILVRDKGVGVSRQPQRRGLGSLLVRSLVEQLGGKLHIDTGSVGTTIYFVVPFTATADAQ